MKGAEPGKLPPHVFKGIKQLLNASGGQVAGGVVSTKFPGVKKAQLEQQFELHDHVSDFYLLNPGVTFKAPQSNAWKQKIERSQAGPTQKKQRKEKSDEPPDPLTHVEVQLVRDLLVEQGGQIKGGILSTRIEGVKKLQLQEHFQVSEIDSGDYWLTEFGSEPDTSIEPPKEPKSKSVKHKPVYSFEPVNSSTGMGLPTQKKQKKEKSAEPPPPLTYEALKKVREILAEHGGQIRMGFLTSMIEGLKKAQLQEHFKVVPISSGDFWLTEFDTFIDESVRSNETVGELQPDVINAVRSAVRANGGIIDGGSLTTIIPGIKKSKLAAHFTIETSDDNGNYVLSEKMRNPTKGNRKGGGKMGKNKNSATARWGSKGHGKKAAYTGPPAALSDVEVQAVYELVLDNGGSMQGGVLSTKIPGIKKAQLADHFQIDEVKSGEYMVTIL